MLKKYKIFQSLGFFGVEKGTARGALQFLSTSKAILAAHKNLLVITPQGRFADVRERPLHFEGGLGALAARLTGMIFLPCAVEYVFWEESHPEILINFGGFVELGEGATLLDASLNSSSTYCTKMLEEQLRIAQDILAAESVKREVSQFKVSWSSDGVGIGVYDLWRGMLAKFRGEVFQRMHGTK